MANQLHADLECVLAANELFWNKLISISATTDDDPSHQNELIIAASNIRAKMLSSISCAKSLFETNMQCLAMILTLQKQKHDIEFQFQDEIKVNLRIKLVLLINYFLKHAYRYFEDNSSPHGVVDDHRRYAAARYRTQ